MQENPTIWNEFENRVYSKKSIDYRIKNYPENYTENYPENYPENCGENSEECTGGLGRSPR